MKTGSSAHAEKHTDEREELVKVPDWARQKPARSWKRRALSFTRVVRTDGLCRSGPCKSPTKHILLSGIWWSSLNTRALGQ